VHRQAPPPFSKQGLQVPARLYFPLDLVKLTLDLVKLALDLVKLALDLVKLALDLVKLPLDLVKLPLDLVKLPLDLVTLALGLEITALDRVEHLTRINESRKMNRFHPMQSRHRLQLQVNLLKSHRMVSTPMRMMGLHRMPRRKSHGLYSIV
jgi:hypothetical protein